MPALHRYNTAAKLALPQVGSMSLACVPLRNPRLDGVRSEVFQVYVRGCSRNATDLLLFPLATARGLSNTSSVQRQICTHQTNVWTCEHYPTIFMNRF